MKATNCRKDAMTHYLEKELYQLLSKNRDIFNTLQNASLDGLWYLDLEAPENEWMNDRFWEILGYNPKIENIYHQNGKT